MQRLKRVWGVQFYQFEPSFFCEIISLQNRNKRKSMYFFLMNQFYATKCCRQLTKKWHLPWKKVSVEKAYKPNIIKIGILHFIPIFFAALLKNNFCISFLLQYSYKPVRRMKMMRTSDVNQSIYFLFFFIIKRSHLKTQIPPKMLSKNKTSIYKQPLLKLKRFLWIIS